MKKKPKSDKHKLYEEKYKKQLTSYKTVKTSLKSIIRKKTSLQPITDAVINVNKIIIHTYQFLKLYCLKQYEKNKTIPEITEQLINLIMKVLASKDNRGKKPSKQTQKLMNTLTKFYNTEYKPLLYDSLDLCYTHLNTVLDYEKVTIITGINNHISEHFEAFINRYINVLVNKQQILDEIKNPTINIYSSNFNITGQDNTITKSIQLPKALKKEMKKRYLGDLSALKKDILMNTDTCHKKYDDLKNKIRTTIFKDIPTNKSLYAQVNDNPLDFLIPLIKISIEIENKGEKTINCFPLRKNITPKYIKIDTTTVVHLLFSNIENKSKYLNDGHTIKYRDEIWNMVFRRNNKVFKNKNYVFNNQICTDGVGCSLLFIRKDLYNPLKKVRIHSMKKPYNFRSIRYVDEMTEEEKEKYKEYKDSALDPGKSDLFFATNGNTQIINGKHKTETFRYTQNSRRKETKSKKYRDIRNNDKRITKVLIDPFLRHLIAYDGIELYSYLVDGKEKEKDKWKSVEELESLLSVINSKSCIYKKVKEYIKCKNYVNTFIQEYYENELFRKLKWYSYINIQRNEAKMINNFKEKFGSSKDTIVYMGDWGCRNHIKNGEPTKGKGLRKIFIRAGYSTFLVDEYNTSKKNFITKKNNEKFRKRRNPRPKKDISKNSFSKSKPNQNTDKNKVRKIHGLLRSKTVKGAKSSKHILVNRDLNGSMNILIKARCIIRDNPIPIHLRR